MKIVSWNINGYRAITGQNQSKRLDVVSFENKLFDYIANDNPDIICVQETKANIEQINEHLRYPPGYNGYYYSATSKKGYSGVALFAKLNPRDVKFGLGIEKFDSEGRVIETDFDRFVHFNIYFPKGYTDDPRLDFKLVFYDAVIKRCKNLIADGRDIIVSGDFNTARTPIDLANPEQNTNTSGFLQVERDKMEEFFDIGFIDIYRKFVTEGGNYTWWSNRANSRKRNIGWRIDYHLISPGLESQVVNSKQQPEVEGSDHCPVVVELK